MKKTSSVKWFHKRIIDFIENKKQTLNEIETTGTFSRYFNSILFELSELL